MEKQWGCREVAEGGFLVEPPFRGKIYSYSYSCRVVLYSFCD